MNIRKAKIEDYDEIIELYKELYDAEKIFDENLTNIYNISEKQKEEIQKRIKSRKEIFLVAEEDNKIIGLIDGYIIDNSNHIEKVGYLDHLCVNKNYRNLGIGENLIEEFSNKMKSKNVTYLKLNAFERNLPAIALYKKSGCYRNQRFRHPHVHFASQICTNQGNLTLLLQKNLAIFPMQ